MKHLNFFTLCAGLLLAIGILLISHTRIQAQNFVNSDLEGSVFGSSTLAPGWQAVTVGDPVSLATNTNVGDTPDLCSANLPNPDLGINGIAYSGNTFMSGLRSSNFVSFDEGIKQTVSGLQIGQTYTIEFYQSVVKMVSLLDQSGSWSVYMDNTLLGVTAVSTSDLAYDDPNLIWEARSVDFTPTATTHTFKFMPTDDDTNLASSFDDIEAGLRMGIDLITINQNCTLELGPDVVLCESQLPYEIGTDLAGTYNWSTGASSSNIEITESGTYTLEVNASCGLLTDAITVEVINDIPPVNLGEDISTCTQNFPLELTADVEGQYLWSTGESSQTITVSEPGEYSVQVSNLCGTVEDVITVSEIIDNINLDLGQDLVLCADEFPYTLNAGEYESHQWTNGENTQSINVPGPGEYSVTVTDPCGQSSDNITIELVNAPSAFTLGENITLCENEFPLTLEIPETENNIAWSTGADEEAITINAAGIYTAEISNQCGSSTASITIVANPNLLAEESFTICQGQSVDFLSQTFTEEGTFNYTVPSETDSGCDTFWSVNVEVIPQDTIYALLQIDDSGMVSYNENTYDQPGLYFLTELAETGCERTVIISVEDNSEVLVYVPSAFTPDNNGLNELFKPVVTLIGDISLVDFQFQIYDRWGHTIYESTDHETVGWNGSGAMNKGYYVQDGIYNWVLKYGSTKNTDRAITYGSVVIVR